MTLRLLWFVIYVPGVPSGHSGNRVAGIKIREVSEPHRSS